MSSGIDALEELALRLAEAIKDMVEGIDESPSVDPEEAFNARFTTGLQQRIETAASWSDVSQAVVVAQTDVADANSAVRNKLPDHAAALVELDSQSLEEKLTTAESAKSTFDEQKEQFETAYSQIAGLTVIRGWSDPLSSDLKARKEKIVKTDDDVKTERDKHEYGAALRVVNENELSRLASEGKEARGTYDEALNKYTNEYANDLHARITKIVIGWGDGLSTDLSEKQTALNEVSVKIADQADAHEYVKALELLTSLDVKVKVEEAEAAKKTFDDKKKYEAGLPGAELKLSKLKGHKQKDVIGTEIGKIEGYITDAKNHAKAPGFDYEKANLELAKVDPEYGPAIKAADHAKEVKGWYENYKTKADFMADHQGKAMIEGTGGLLEVLTNRLGTLKGKIDLEEFKTDTQYQAARQVAVQVDTSYKSALQMANGYGDYLGQLSNAKLKLEALKSHPNKAAIPAAKINFIKDDLIAGAETKVSSGLIPEAFNLLSQVEAKYQEAKGLAENAGKDLYDQALVGIDVPADNPVIADEILAIKAKLDKAAKFAGAKQYKLATDLLTEVAAACTAAKKTAEREAAFANADSAVSSMNPVDSSSSLEAVGKVQTLLDKLKDHPVKTVVTTEVVGEIQTKINDGKTLACA